MILIKLGGSIITDKSEYRVFNKERVSRLCREISESGVPAIVVHGAGSFGHIIAKRFSIQNGYSGPEQIPAVAQIQQDVRELSLMVVKELNSCGLPAVSVPPGSVMISDSGTPSFVCTEPLAALWKTGIMPVLFGDVLMDRTKGFSICSGDDIIRLLADVFDPEKIIFVSDVNGLYTSNPKTDPDAELIREVTEEKLRSVSASQTVDDVTGGVAGKMRSMLDLCGKGRECILINGTVPGNLAAAIKGEIAECTIARNRNVHTQQESRTYQDLRRRKNRPRLLLLGRRQVLSQRPPGDRCR